jgi:hypothetical protein
MQTVGPANQVMPLVVFGDFNGALLTETRLPQRQDPVWLSTRAN